MSKGPLVKFQKIIATLIFLAPFWLASPSFASGAAAGESPGSRPAYFAIQCVEFQASPRDGESPRALWAQAIRALKIASLPPGAGQGEAGVWFGTVARASVSDSLALLSSVGEARVGLSQSQTRRPGAAVRFSGPDLAAGQSLSVSGALRGVHDLAVNWRFYPGQANARIYATHGFATLSSSRSLVIAYAREGSLRIMVLSSAPAASSSPLAVW